MSLRADYEAVARCKATVRTGKQCTREALIWHKGKGYCQQHHTREIERMMVLPEKPQPGIG